MGAAEYYRQLRAGARGAVELVFEVAFDSAQDRTGISGGLVLAHQPDQVAPAAEAATLEDSRCSGGDVGAAARWALTEPGETFLQ
jgi:hypothetical protein